MANGFLDRLWEAYTDLIRREKSKPSQESLAERIANLSGQPVRQHDISRWLQGKGRPSYEELPAVATVLGVRKYWLAFNDGPMLEEPRKKGKVDVARDVAVGSPKDVRKHA